MQVDNLSWFPGHMTKTRRMITAEIKPLRFCNDAHHKCNDPAPDPKVAEHRTKLTQCNDRHST